jgi:hypothetical protein
MSYCESVFGLLFAYIDFPFLLVFLRLLLAIKGLIWRPLMVVHVVESTYFSQTLNTIRHIA